MFGLFLSCFISLYPTSFSFLSYCLAPCGKCVSSCFLKLYGFKTIHCMFYVFNLNTLSQKKKKNIQLSQKTWAMATYTYTSSNQENSSLDFLCYSGSPLVRPERSQTACFACPEQSNNGDISNINYPHQSKSETSIQKKA